MAPSEITKKDGASKIAQLRFKKRKESIMKMTKELSILCDIKVCALVSDPDNGTIETWPQNCLEVQEIVKEHVFKNKKVGKKHQDKKKSSNIIKIVDQKLESVNKRIESLKNNMKYNGNSAIQETLEHHDHNKSMSCDNGAGSGGSSIAPPCVQNMQYNDEKQCCSIQNFYGNSVIQETLEEHDQNKLMNCDNGVGSGGSSIALPCVQDMQCGVSGTLEPVAWSSSQFDQALKAIETELMGDFEEFEQVLESMPDNTIVDGLVEALNTDSTSVFPYQECQMEDYWIQENTTNDEIWAYLQGLGLQSVLQSRDGIDYQ